jgi:hypothetical protein
MLATRTLAIENLWGPKKVVIKTLVVKKCVATKSHFSHHTLYGDRNKFNFDHLHFSPR